MIRKQLLLILAVLCLSVGHFANAQEAKFKALFIMKFAQYIEWPQGNNSLVIGVLGNSPIAPELEKFATQTINIKVVTVKSTDEASKCNILFIPETKSKQLGEMVSAIGGGSTLLVMENDSGVGKGADIGFYIEESKLRFLISKKDIETKKMVPSSKLLALGKTI